MYNQFPHVLVLWIVFYEKEIVWNYWKGNYAADADLVQWIYLFMVSAC